MAMTDRKTPAWLDPSHPNYRRWKRSRKLSEDRGEYVKSVINNLTDCKNLNILDLGSGEGGTSSILSNGNNVISMDISLERLQRQKDKNKNYDLILGDAIRLPFKNSSFDLIILQDVIEHVQSPAVLINNISIVLKPGGIVYVSTPNKHSILNLIADPHWGMPLASVLKENRSTNIFKIFQKKRIQQA